MATPGNPIGDVRLMATTMRRRSRRFALGSRLQGGPFDYTSSHDPVPVPLETEAILVLAGSGVTGFSPAHHVDLEFYDRYYKPGVYHDAHRRHFQGWHAE